MTSDAATSRPPAFERALHFGRFSLDPARKLLLDDGRAVRLGGRALDLLIALVERAGDVVSHDDLFARVWPHTVVEESSLRVHMSSLRKALGDGLGDTRYIASLPGRGYSFVMDVIESSPPAGVAQARAAVDAPAMTAMSTSTPGLPSRLTGVIGREEVLVALAAKLREGRFVTLVGPGGIGKTTTALALADAIAGHYADGACFVDLAPLDEPSLVPGALATAIGVAAPEPCPWSAVESALESREMLVVLDNCEHLIVAAATLAERVLRAAPRVRVLATSREPLEAEAETVHRLESLAVPPAEHGLGIADALAFPALRLFVERATASADDFRLTPANLAATVRICRHLDGVPLAIELAAARVGSLGIPALAERLDDVFRLLRRGRRTVLPRHQTLQALLDWSHDLLDDDERSVLHRLSAFRSSFTLEAAAELASCERIPPQRVMTCVLDLVSRSLVELEAGAATRYRLLFVARLYAWERLADDGSTDEIGRRHALCIRNALARANAELGERRTTLAAWRAAHACAMPDVRAALDWTHGPRGDAILGAELVIESGRLQLEIGLNDEFLPRALGALKTLRAQAVVPPELELRLLTLLCMVGGQSLLECEIPPEATAQLEALAPRVGTPLQQRVALFALCVNAFGRGDYPLVAERARRFAALPRDASDPGNAGALLMGRRFGAQSKLYLGDHAGAWADSEHVLEQAGTWVAGTYSQMPLPLSMGLVQARILWLRGLADQALERALGTLRFCEGAHPFAYSQALTLGIIPILLWRGDDEHALSFVARLVDHEVTHFQSFWMAWGAAYCKALALRGHDVEALRQRLGGVDGMNTMQADMLATLAGELVGPEDVARAEAGTAAWCAPEVLRAHGRRLASETILRRALELARQQGARAWELRAATSLAALWQRQGRLGEASRLLAGTLAGLVEGRACADVRRAEALLAAWAGVS